MDAFPEETFQGRVGKIRLNASMPQNVVTYTVEIITDNRSGRRLPYLSANVQFELDRRNDVLLAPTAALRWNPSREPVAPQLQETSAANFVGRDPSDGARGDAAAHGILWILDGQQLRPLKVRLGLTDGAMTEVKGQHLAEGLEIVTGQQSPTARGSDTTNPFAMPSASPGIRWPIQFPRCSSRSSIFRKKVQLGLLSKTQLPY